jgi:class 3 adenylate cyclase
MLADRRRSDADLQRELAELRRTLDEALHERDEALHERDEALQRETATAEVLQVINSSPGNLAPVFHEMLEKTLMLCEASFGTLSSYAEGHIHTLASRGVPPALADFLSKPRPPAPGGRWGRIIQGESLSHITDLAAEGTEGNPTRRAFVVLGRARSMLWIALRQQERLLGILSIYRTEVRPFTDKQIALLQNFAAQAIIAMENARLITETREALERQTATAEVLGVINSSPGDLAPVFDAMLEKALHFCDAVFGVLVKVVGEHVEFVAQRNVPQALADFIVRAPMRVDPATILGHSIMERQIVHTLDNADSDAYRERAPLAVAAVELGGVRTILHVPLIRENDVLGVLIVFRQEVKPFTDKQIALLQNFATQAVIAMENARLITETREALEQQTATAEVLGVINSSPGNLAPVFDAMLEKAMRLCGAAFGLMMVTDGEEAPTVASRGVPTAFAEFRRTNPVSMAKGPIFSRLLADEAIVHTLDLKDDDAYRRGDPLRCATVDLGGGRTSLMVALRRDREVVGAIHLYRQEVRPFTDKQIALLQNFAAQAVIAMENARLLGELRARNNEIAEWNRELEARVATQLAELERTGMLRRFLAPQLADLIIAQGNDSILESHRREIVVVFCDIRGFTAFAERAEPEEVMALLRDYHAALGPIVARFEGTLDHYSGDGVMVFFNDPLPTPEPAKRAIEMAVAMREAAQQVLKTWRRHGHDLGFGVGISQGYATLGQIGFAERMDYTAIGTVCNLAARLCDEAKDGQILISRRVAVAVEDDAKLEEIGEVALKGLSQAVAVFNVVQ